MKIKEVLRKVGNFGNRVEALKAISAYVYLTFLIYVDEEL